VAGEAGVYCLRAWQVYLRLYKRVDLSGQLFCLTPHPEPPPKGPQVLPNSSISYRN
jgi:hypothetical protein